MVPPQPGAGRGLAAAIGMLVMAVIVLAISNARIARTSRDLATALGDKDVALKAARESETRARTNETRARNSADEADRQRVRAEAGEAQARAAVHQFFTRVTEDALLKAPGLQALRRDLLRSALRFYEEFLKQRGDDPGLRAAAGATCTSAWAGSSKTSGMTTGEYKSYQAARAIYQALAQGEARRPRRPGRAGRVPVSPGRVAEAIDIYERLIKLDPTNPRYRRELAEAYNSQAIYQRAAQQGRRGPGGTPQGAGPPRGPGPRVPRRPEARNNLAGTLNNLGSCSADRVTSRTRWRCISGRSSTAKSPSPRPPR